VIPKADIVAWRQWAPWVSDANVEQDLIMSRAIVDIFCNPFLTNELAFRGGTALHKLYFKVPRRYSEDIDIIQIKAGPIGPILDTIQKVLNPVLGEPRRKQTTDGVTLSYRVASEGPPVVPLRLKVEINTREHFAVMGFQRVRFEVRSRWFSGACEINTFTLEELLSTKMRALYQRRKGRDLFDIWLGLKEAKADPVKIVAVFKQYMEAEGNTIDRRSFEKNLQGKMKHPGFVSDIRPLLPADVEYEEQPAYTLIRDEILARIDER
jgi:predicted nucleotidyltransferase component of viral defense system